MSTSILDIYKKITSLPLICMKSIKMYAQFITYTTIFPYDIDTLVEGCDISTANITEIQQTCNKPRIWVSLQHKGKLYWEPNKCNPLTSGRCGCNLKLVIFKLKSRIDIMSISCEIAFMLMPQDLI